MFKVSDSRSNHSSPRGGVDLKKNVSVHSTKFIFFIYWLQTVTLAKHGCDLTSYCPICMSIM